MFKKLLKSLTFTSQNNTFFNCSLIFVLSILGMNGVEAQVANYQVEQLPYGSGLTYSTIAPPANYAPLPVSPAVPARTNLETGTTTIVDKIYTTTLPFAFNFNGTTYASGTTIYVSSNGFVSFGTTSPSATNWFPISTNGGDGVISLYGRRMSVVSPTTTAANISTFIENTGVNVAPNRIFKIQWILRRRIDGAAPGASEGTSNVAFQLWLYETSSLIEFHYNSASFSLGSTYGVALTGQVGLRGSDNTDYLNLSHTNSTANWPAQTSQMTLGSQLIGGASSNTASVVTRGGAGTTNAQIVAASNRVFRFRPVTCFAPTSLSVTSITSTSATLNWIAPTPAPAQGYQYYVGVNALDVPNASSTPTGSVGVGIITASLTSLTPASQQYVYVRSRCSASDYSSWVPILFSTLCSPTNVTYTQNFDGPVVPAVSPYLTNSLPTCTTNQTIGTSHPWSTASATYYTTSGMTGNILMYDGQYPAAGVAANAWFYTQGINLTVGQQYKMSFKYGGGTTTTNRLKVSYGLAPNDTSMLLNLDDLPNIKSSPTTNVIYFTAPTTNVYYFGLNAYSIANQERLFVDDLVIELANCLKPTAVSVANITQSSALLTWSEPSPAPSNGYAYYYSNSATAPTNSTPASGTVGTGATTIVLSGLTSSTNYYFWVRSICGTELGEWVALNNSGSPFFTTLFVPTYCNPAPTSVDNLGIVNVTCGSINNTTTTEANNYGNFSALSTNVSPSGTVNVAITFNTGTYDYNTKVWVDWNNNGSFLDAGENVYTGLSAASSPNTLNAIFTVPAGQPIGQVRMRIGGADIDALTGTGAGQGPCYNGSWATFEDYSLNVVVPPLPLSLNITSSTQCANTNSPLVQITPAELANYQSYSWFPNVGVIGTPALGYTFNTSSTTVYTLTATMTSSPFSVRTLTYTYNASPTPSPITITPASTTVCPSGPAVQLMATGGIVPNIVVTPVSQNFNSGNGGWVSATATIAPAHINGVIAASYWTIQNTGYNPAGSSGITSVVSNDSSPFFISNSDAQGSGSTTHVTLTSPTFSLATYTDASLSFYHYYKPYNGGAYLEITTNASNATPTWVTLQSWTTATQGAPTNFTQFIYNLNSYIGQTDLKIRFRYNSNWGFVWAVDNVVVSGSSASAVVWNNNSTPVANGVAVPGLYSSYTSSTVNSPYIAGTAVASVYTLPSSATTYIASVSTSAPVCTASNTIAVSVNPILGGNASSNQIICGGSPSDITLSGQNGTIVEWQYANDLAFTTPVSISSSAFATLTSAQMGIFTADRYFRAVITNAGCTSYSNVVSVTFNTTNWNGTAWSNGLPSASKRATFSGNYVSSSDALLAASGTPMVLNACSVTVTGGAIVTFSPNYILNVENTVNTLGGTMNFLEGASLIQDNDVTNGVGVTTGGNLGSINYTRSTTVVSEYDYTYWSSPVANQALSNVSPDSPNDYFFTFDPAVANWYNVPSINLMDVGKGYIIRAPYYANGTAGYASTFIGTPNSGTITTPIVIGPTTATPVYRETNLIGNPYPSAINAIAFLSDAANVNNVEGTMYFWTHTTPITANNYTAADYAVFNYSGSTATSPGTGSITPNGYVGAGQSFMIKGINPIAPYPTGASVKTVTFKNSMRAGLGYSNSQFFRSTTSNSDAQTTSPISDEVSSIVNLERNRLWLDVSNADGLFKQTLVGYVQNATDGLDRGFDGEIVNAGNQVSLYTMVDTTKLGIQALALPFDSSDIIPLGFMSSIESTYTISLSNFDGLFNEQSVYLEDKLLNIVHNLKDSNYTFTSAIGTFENRFQLRFTNTLGVNDPVFNDESVIIFKQNQNIVVSASSVSIDKVEVFDIRGRQLFSKNDINSDEFTITNLDASQQVLIVRVTSLEGKVVNKKVIF
ncbi:T9SS sorting signal type C domain-containing protein [Flavobacterium sp.]|uniref:T9SS sorting signal type C domain-containing protein n=1 Tax=Flavobacterium sp. TaxID=239 RepID=UPI00260FC02A|nr:T9SS sorting signal type C domain-containing protein [Flavobacterium sp.]